MGESLHRTGFKRMLIVNGHGGNQGDTPVFHVPGPRLTPADFGDVAKACPSSTWLLFFPGSGFFDYEYANLWFEAA